MKIEKITENKIRIILHTEELSNNNINLTDFINNNITSQKFFLEILNKAEKELGFKTNDCKLLIEAFSSLDEVLVFTITKFVHENKKNKVKLKKKNKFFNSGNIVYKFDSFEEFCKLCTFLNKTSISINNIAKNIALYFYNNTYYLIFIKINLTNENLKKILSIISEFSSIVKNPKHFDSKLIEYGKPIIKLNAFKTGIKYFNNNV